MSLFQDQVDRLLTLHYPALAGTSDEEFGALLEPLRAVADDLDGSATPSRAPYVVVVTSQIVPPEHTVPLLRLHSPTGPGNRQGVVDRHHGEGGLGSYRPIASCAPPAPAYLLVDVERGEEFCGVRPDHATETVLSRGRTPLTIDEGIALATHWPAMLERNKCFMLAGSRRADRRVPALWISDRAPKLGWCWAGNPHTWLGTASAAGRVVS